MDPNATLNKIISICEEWEDYGNNAEASMNELSELILSLHDWISSGGFRPDDWS